MQYSTRALLIVATLIAMGLTFWMSTGEIWLDWFSVVRQWYVGAKAYLALMLVLLMVGFAGGYFSSTSIKSNYAGHAEWAVCSILNVLVYGFVSSGLTWIQYAVDNHEIHISGAMGLLLTFFKSGVIAALALGLFVLVTVGALAYSGRYQRICTSFSVSVWFVLVLAGFLNASFSLSIN